MTALAITGWSVLCAAGVGCDALAEALADSRAGAAPRADCGGLYDEPLPWPEAHLLAGFDVRDFLPRRGTGFFDRVTGLAVVACGLALDDARAALPEAPERVGVVLGTTVGSLRSTMEFSRETLIQERPYLVNPVLFPNTVMNCAAGQAAIRYGLKGVNATVAGGPLAFLQALRYATNALSRGYADALLVGAAEELTPQSAWAAHLGRPGVAPGEGAAVLVLQRAAELGDRARADAEVLAVRTLYAPGDDAGRKRHEALAGCVQAALRDARVAPCDVALVATGDPAGTRVETDAVAAALGETPRETLTVTPLLGDCQAAGGVLQATALLARYRTDRAMRGRASVITGVTSDGGVGVAVLRGGDNGPRRG